MDFLSGNLTLILCGLAGFGLLLAEAFMPGIGIAGLAGVVLEVVAIYSAWVHHGATAALILTVALIAAVGLTVFLSYRSALKGRLSRTSLVLKDAEKPAEAPAAAGLTAYRGQEGIAVTPLRPGGTVEIDGKRVNAASSGELVEKGARVRVTGAVGDHVMVEKL